MSSDDKAVNDETDAKVGYLAASVAELKKVTTPTRQEAMQATLVTIIIITFMSVCLFVLDFVFHRIVSLIIGS